MSFFFLKYNSLIVETDVKRNIPIMFMISLLQGMVFYASIASIYRQTFGITIFEISLIEGINYALTILLEMPWGILADRIGYKKSMIICSFLYFISKIIFYKAYGFAMFLIERILLAFVFSGLTGVDSSILYLSDQENSHRNFGYHSACGTIGMLLSSFIFAFFIKDDLRMSAFATIIPYMFAFILSLFLIEVKDTKKETQKPKILPLFKEILKNKKLIRLLISTALLTQTTQLLAVFLNQDKYLEIGLSLSQIGYINILINFLDTSNALSKKLSDLFGRNRMAIMTLSLQCLFTLCAGFSKNVFLVILSFCMIDVLYGFFMPISSSIQHESIESDDRASMISANSMFIDIICIIVVIVCGRIADYDLKLGILSCAFLLFISVIEYIRSIS